MRLSILILALIPAVFWTCKKSDPPAAVEIPRYKNLHVDTNSGVCIGNSIIAGHPWRYSGLEVAYLSWPDTFGQISYHLSQLTGFQWYNRGWGGQTTVQIRKRFLRDAIGDTSDPGDDRGSVTLPGRPTYVVIEGGVNDIEQHIPLDTIKANIVWMASTCKQNKIHCIVLNCVGEQVGFDSVQQDLIRQINDWLAAGPLDSVQAKIIDINSLWNSGTYGGVSPYNNDNIHFSVLVNPADGVHFTRAGYDTVAHVIYRVAKLAPLYSVVR